MPIHNWPRAEAGTFHAFHNAWVASLQKALNSGLLPDGYYALGEPVAFPAKERIGPDVLAVEMPLPDATANGPARKMGGAIAVADAPPRLQVRELSSEAAWYAARRRRVVVNHASGRRPVALIEIVSPGSKHSRASVEQFVDKAATALDDGLHLQVIDLFPPRRFDPGGMHAVLWSRFGGTYDTPPGSPLTVSAYMADVGVTCYVEPTGVGNTLVDAPLFLTPKLYVNVPLEATYMDAFEGVPQVLRDDIAVP